MYLYGQINACHMYEFRQKFVRKSTYILTYSSYVIVKTTHKVIVIVIKQWSLKTLIIVWVFEQKVSCNMLKGKNKLYQ